MKVVRKKTNNLNDSNAVKPLHNLIFKSERVFEGNETPFTNNELLHLNSQSAPEVYYTNNTQQHLPISLKDVITKLKQKFPKIRNSNCRVNVIKAGKMYQDSSDDQQTVVQTRFFFVFPLLKTTKNTSSKDLFENFDSEVEKGSNFEAREVLQFFPILPEFMGVEIPSFKKLVSYNRGSLIIDDPKFANSFRLSVDTEKKASLFPAQFVKKLGYTTNISKDSYQRIVLIFDFF